MQKISQKLSDCVNYIEAIKFHSFEEKREYYQMSSFRETIAKKIIEDPGKSQDFVKYNCQYISRIYPRARRHDSSNLEVISFFNAGCQMGKKKTYRILGVLSRPSILPALEFKPTIFNIFENHLRTLGTSVKILRHKSISAKL